MKTLLTATLFALTIASQSAYSQDRYNSYFKDNMQELAEDAGLSTELPSLPLMRVFEYQEIQKTLESDGFQFIKIYAVEGVSHTYKFTARDMETGISYKGLAMVINGTETAL